jgi:hypothetical protein
MGYFSNLAIDSWENYYDVSWTTHEQQLLWWWEDLQSLLDEMRSWGAPYSGSVTYTDDELRYMLPEHPRGHSLRKNGTIRDVEKALELVAQELKDKYGIDVQPEKSEEPELDELTENQLSFFLILPPAVLQNTA